MTELIAPAIGLLYVGYTLVRLRAERSAARRRAEGAAGSAEARARRRDARELGILTGLEILILGFWYLGLPFPAAFPLPLSAAPRWLGIGLGAAGLALVAWAGEVLDGEYSSVVELKEGHRLVVAGPYARIRHPIYTGLILLNLGVALAAANAVVALVWTAGLGLVLARRVPREEAFLASRFGAAWEAHAGRTGRFLPRLGAPGRRAPEPP